MCGFVRDFDQPVVVLRYDLADRVELRARIQWRIARTRQRHDLDVKSMLRRNLEQTRQRLAPVLGREIHPSTTHRQHADDGEALAFGPGEKAIDFVLFPPRDVLEQSEGRDAAPLEWMTIGGCEARAGHAKVTLDTHGGRAAIAGRNVQTN